ncbi:YhcN/YlaJ family sporulation lipoprotein [Melghiribacillus thermohalophilus]|uniref:YhcN/YlaJ family sporulation lipoprotein n=1 Tax=Melghiribacillus thermohalophilus TaxID=1324956 RepID=A0A4R3MUN2_9BACI|nr:YhcN/YlaJ family sporulation lipoprotein [Melghiribacillus thermohalophilus]TCT17998.1 YhcN/YlaJ family sporulation lipoprotein [Melghiribacillus thermohalophilus]
MKKIALLGVSALTAITIAGCQGDEGLGTNNNYDTGVEPTRYTENNDIEPNRDRVGMDNNDLGPNYNDPDRNGVNNNEAGPNYNGTNQDRNWNRDRGLNGDGDNLMNENNRFEVADDAADRIAEEVREVERAYVLAGNNNAYVAAVLDNDQERIDADLRTRIERVVRSIDRDIDNVYVSANTEFVDLSEGYINGDNRDDDGFVEEFNEMTQRLFPDMD